MSFGRHFTFPPRMRDREPPAVLPRATRAGVYARSEVVVAVPKSPEPVRDESYRRLVAALPCFHCRIEGYSQAAHPNTGKAKGKKQSDDLCFSLCCDRPGVLGCHTKFDRYLLVPRAAMPAYEAQALAWTREQLEMTACQ